MRLHIRIFFLCQKCPGPFIVKDFIKYLIMHNLRTKITDQADPFFLYRPDKGLHFIKMLHDIAGHRPAINCIDFFP